MKITETLKQNMASCPALLGALSREMRNQMNAIVAFAYLLNKTEYSGREKEEFSGLIYESCEQLISMFDNFLDSVIIDSQNPESKPLICDTGKMFKSLFSEFRETLQKDKYKEIILVTESQSFKDPEYSIDTNITTRIIRNLFQNALYSTKSGYIKAGYYCRNERLTFYILDSGQGFNKSKEFIQTQDPAQSLARYNDIYAAVNLILTKKMVRLLNGSLWIEPNALTGSGIYFTIPVTSGKTENSNDNYMNTKITI